MRESIILFGISFVAACWVIVIGHQLDWGTFNVERYPSIRGSLYLAYTVVAISASLLAAVIVLMFVKRDI